jgi:hypothetical protein
MSLLGALGKAKWLLRNIVALSQGFLDMVALIFGLASDENMVVLRVLTLDILYDAVR